MKGQSVLQKEAFRVLGETSRTFIIPIKQLGPGLQEAVSSAYLSMRAIDEIEDHHTLPKPSKIELLESISAMLTEGFDEQQYQQAVEPYRTYLPEVSLRLGDWLKLSPDHTRGTVSKYTATMAKGMAEWVAKDWKISNKEGLDDYTYYVAGLVGVMLSELWELYGECKIHPDQSIAFGRGLQLVNIISNRNEDLERGVDFYPSGWKFEDMINYARQNLKVADAYTKKIKVNSIYNFCRIPLDLAFGTLEAIESGKSKLNRASVLKIVSGAVR